MYCIYEGKYKISGFGIDRCLLSDDLDPVRKKECYGINIITLFFKKKTIRHFLQSLKKNKNIKDNLNFTVFRIAVITH